MASLKDEAEVLRLGLIHGLVTATDVMAWADAQILADSVVEAPVVLDLTVSERRPLHELVELLGKVPGDIDRVAVGRELAAMLGRGLAAQEIDVVLVARTMLRLLQDGFAPDDKFETMAYVADDGVDLALDGTFGTLADLEAELRPFLQRYERATIRNVPPGP